MDVWFFICAFQPVQDQYTILRLINQVKRHSCIWDEADSNYRNSIARTEAWNAIAKQTGIFVPILMRKWRSLTCSYRRIKAELIKKQEQHPGNGNIMLGQWASRED